MLTPDQLSLVTILLGQTDLLQFAANEFADFRNILFGTFVAQVQILAHIVVCIILLACLSWLFADVGQCPRDCSESPLFSCGTRLFVRECNRV